MTQRVIYRGTTEYLDVDVTSDVELAAQVVQVAFDRGTWLTAAWIGAAGTTRTCRVLLNAGNIPADRTDSTVFVKVTDTPEIPVFSAGPIKIV